MAARTRRRRGPKGPDRAGPFAAGLALLAMRVYAGAFFLVTAWWKLIEPGFTVGEKIAHFRANEYANFIAAATQHPPVVFGVELRFFADLLQGVARPLASVGAPAVLFFEAVLGISLVLGFGVRLFATLGFLLMLVFSVGKPQPLADPGEPVGVFLFTVHSANWPLTVILLALALTAAGRVVGLDGWLRRRGALPWTRWMG